MNRGGKIVTDIRGLVELFAAHCTERETLSALAAVAANRERWPAAHDLFDKIREKTAAAYREANAALLVQYEFEEICAKTLYNLSLPKAPFDPDSAYWVVPNALSLARILGVGDGPVLRVVVD